MSLKDLDLKPLYDSDEDNILEDFYIPTLSEAVVYKRTAGYFSSNALAIAAQGIANFIRNGGKIQLLANVVLSTRDYEAVKNITENSQLLKKTEEEFINSLDKIEDELQKNHIKMLGWMLKNGKLEMKIAVGINKASLMHQKVGILEDKDGNCLSFTGSDNETKKGWLDNIEDFHVFCSWIEGDKKHLEADIKTFEKFWSGEPKRTKVFSISNAIKEKLIKMAPENDDEFEELSETTTKELLERHRKRLIEIKETKKNETVNIEKLLRYYQKDAREKWFENKKIGFLSMATGTGKTEAAIGIIKRLVDENDSLFIVIAVEGQSLLDQWNSSLKKYGYKSSGASSKFKDWDKIFRKKVMGVSLGYEKYAILVTTYETFSSSRFTEIAETITCNSLLICDEVHHAGAPELRKGLINKYNFRLGLSATPDRWFDDEGTNFLHKYFGTTVYTFSMKRALTEVNPTTGKTYLCQYKYYPIIVPLTLEENEDFIRLSKSIGSRCHVLGKYDPTDNKLKLLALKRADIKKNAKLKTVELERIFNILDGDLTHCIIYCSGKQMADVKKLLQKYQIIYHEFTQYQKDPKLREKLLKGFELGRENGGYDVLLAIACLNEGIDLPSAKAGIIMESSTNPIEFIQRRGRLLRQPVNKNASKEALVYDLIVETSCEDVESGDFKELERREMQKEFDRVVEFSHLAINKREALNTLESIVKKYNLVIKVKDDI